ncbi:MAG: hypothetical protein AAFW81_01085 [Pseudomonadota bacterium]
MLLRRVIEHVKAQNWTAVALDFVIVVVGVFVGLQVQQWAEEQTRKSQEAAYLQRLHDEVETLIATRNPIIEEREKWHIEMQSALRAIFSDADAELTDDQCRGIAYNYFVSNPTDHLGSLLELQSSGRISIIRNERVSEALRSYLLTRARARDSQEQISVLIKPLGPAYPQLMKVDTPSLVGARAVTSARFVCDLEAMRADDRFLQDLDIAQSHVAFHTFDNARVSAKLDELQRVLLDELGSSALEAR